ncbi:peptidoglycan-binding protein [Peterkaempfera sp. SMS 1(5)a]|uniref:peptidoglycan-binding domain-containing protein n=1 Tax=Peterkaempfera podocarpi TaxID=3232308 RepID=UPI0036700283
MIRLRLGALGAVLLTSGALSLSGPVQAAPAGPDCSYTSPSYRAALSYGQTGAGVKQAQCLSNVWGGVPKLTVDGVFGVRTLKKVEWIQGCHGLKVNGVIGPETWEVLYHPALDCYNPYPA